MKTRLLLAFAFAAGAAACSDPAPDAFTFRGEIAGMDGEKISVDGSGYYTPKTSGEMKAEVFYEDGSKTVVTKNIVLK